MTLLRWLGKAEGLSYLLLLLVAMPLKYLLDRPGMVHVVGWVHGVLFLAFGFSLLAVWIRRRWSFGRVALVMMAALLPFGPFVVDPRLARWERS
ncbi:MAG: DUF3817 domain-containing protein [Verrucomicrobiota bacterium]